jgi:hypothetical protein
MTFLAFIGFTAGALVFVAQNYHTAKEYTSQELMIENEKNTDTCVSSNDKTFIWYSSQ